MAKKGEKVDVEIQFRNRRLFIEALKLLPPWIFGATVWYLFTKIVLDRLTKDKPGTEINAALLASDVAGVTFPPGVAVAALIDVTLAGLGITVPTIIEELKKVVPGEFPEAAKPGADVWDPLLISKFFDPYVKKLFGIK